VHPCALLWDILDTPVSMEVRALLLVVVFAAGCGARSMLALSGEEQAAAGATGTTAAGAASAGASAAGTTAAGGAVGADAGGSAGSIGTMGADCFRVQCQHQGTCNRSILCGASGCFPIETCSCLPGLIGAHCERVRSRPECNAGPSVRCPELSFLTFSNPGLLWSGGANQPFVAGSDVTLSITISNNGLAAISDSCISVTVNQPTNGIWANEGNPAQLGVGENNYRFNVEFSSAIQSGTSIYFTVWTGVLGQSCNADNYFTFAFTAP